MSNWKLVLATAGVGAIVSLAATNLGEEHHDSVEHLARGDSATGTTYTQPSAAAMSTGVTATETTPAVVAATTMALPTLTTAPAAPCPNNGAVLPGGCH